MYAPEQYLRDVYAQRSYIIIIIEYVPSHGDKSTRNFFSRSVKRADEFRIVYNYTITRYNRLGAQ
jgi:hypothetical protein